MELNFDEHKSQNCYKIIAMPRMRSATPLNALFFKLFLKNDPGQHLKIIEFHETVIKFKGFDISAGDRENFKKGNKIVSQILQKTS
jgi:hypothetical protein